MTRTRRLVARNIRKLRTERGWSCEELGRRVRLTRGGVSAIEVGRVSPPLDTCERFAAAFEVALSEIIPMGLVRRSAGHAARDVTKHD
jgi:DNA-binding XRE family transcriptional regulator